MVSGGMERGAASGASGPRVYVPVALPDSSVQTYAVLEFVGFSSASAHRLPSPAAADAAAAVSLPAIKPPAFTSIQADASPREHADKTLAGMKKACGAAAIAAAGRPLPATLGAARGVSVSQTDRETVVHTSPSNFREVVRQLTGAPGGGDDGGLLPVTLPARHANRGDVGNGGGRADAGRSEKELGPRKPALKLHERRKGMKSLEKLSTSQRELPPLLLPSPVTPLASDFEKFYIPTTPTTSQGSDGVSPTSELQASREGASPCQQLVIIPENGFYVHPDRTNSTAPTLLNLFPNSPARSPRI